MDSVFPAGPIDPDLGPGDRGPGDLGSGDRGSGGRAVRRPAEVAVVAVVAAGGALGACARFGASRLWPEAAGAFPWTTLGVNVLGCFVIGSFMVMITEGWTAHRLVRPFVGTGVLGGFTTFSTYAVDVRRLVELGQARTALAYLAGTVVAALVAVWTGAAATRLALAARSPR